MSAVALGQEAGRVVAVVPEKPNPDGVDLKIDEAAQGGFWRGVSDLCKSKKFQAVVISAALILVIFLATNPAGWLASAVLISSFAVKLILSGIVLLANWAICKYRENEPILPCCSEPDSESESQMTSPTFSDYKDSPPLAERARVRAQLDDEPASPVPMPRQKKVAVSKIRPADVLHKSSVWAQSEPVYQTVFQPAEDVEVEDVSPDLSRLIPPKRKNGTDMQWSSRARVATRVKRTPMPIDGSRPMMFEESRYNEVAKGWIIPGEAPEDD